MRTLSVFFLAGSVCLLAIAYGSLAVYAFPDVALSGVDTTGVNDRFFCDIFPFFCAPSPPSAPTCVPPTPPTFCTSVPVRSFNGRTNDANCTSFYCCNGAVPAIPNAIAGVRGNMTTQSQCIDYCRLNPTAKTCGYINDWGVCAVSSCGVEGYNASLPVAQQCNRPYNGTNFQFCYCTKCP